MKAYALCRTRVDYGNGGKRYAGTVRFAENDIEDFAAYMAAIVEHFRDADKKEATPSWRSAVQRIRAGQVPRYNPRPREAAAP